jgi:hypothetical protein
MSEAQTAVRPVQAEIKPPAGETKIGVPQSSETAGKGQETAATLANTAEQGPEKALGKLAGKQTFGEKNDEADRLLMEAFSEGDRKTVSKNGAEQVDPNAKTPEQTTPDAVTDTGKAQTQETPVDTSQPKANETPTEITNKQTPPSTDATQETPATSPPNNTLEANNLKIQALEQQLKDGTINQAKYDQQAKVLYHERAALYDTYQVDPKKSKEVNEGWNDTPAAFHEPTADERAQGEQVLKTETEKLQEKAIMVQMGEVGLRLGALGVQDGEIIMQNIAKQPESLPAIGELLKGSTRDEVIKNISDKLAEAQKLLQSLTETPDAENKTGDVADKKSKLSQFLKILALILAGVAAAAVAGPALATAGVVLAGAGGVAALSENK